MNPELLQMLMQYMPTQNEMNPSMFGGNSGMYSMPMFDKVNPIGIPSDEQRNAMNNMAYMSDMDKIQSNANSVNTNANRPMSTESDAEKEAMRKKYLMMSMYNNGAFGYTSPTQFNNSYYFNQLGKGIKGENAGQAIMGGLGALLSGAIDTFAGMGEQNMSDFFKNESRQKIADFMKNSVGRKSIANNQAMGVFEDGGEAQGVAPEEIMTAYFDANQFTEEDAQNFMEGLQSLAPEEQDAAFQEMAMSLQGQTQPPMQGQMQAQQAPAPQKKQSLMSELFGSAPTNQTAKVMERKKGEFTLMSMEELPITKGEAMEFKKYL